MRISARLRQLHELKFFEQIPTRCRRGGASRSESKSKGLLENNLSLRTSPQTGVAIPRIFKHLGSKTKLFPSNRGAATPVTSVTGSQRHAFLTAPTITLSATSRPKRNESEQLVERIPRTEAHNLPQRAVRRAANRNDHSCRWQLYHKK